MRWISGTRDYWHITAGTVCCSSPTQSLESYEEYQIQSARDAVEMSTGWLSRTVQ